MGVLSSLAGHLNYWKLSLGLYEKTSKRKKLQIITLQDLLRYFSRSVKHFAFITVKNGKL